jgi:hypothetical protein
MRDSAQHTEYYFTEFDYKAYNIELIYGIGIKEMGLHGLTMENAAIVSVDKFNDLGFIFSFSGCSKSDFTFECYACLCRGLWIRCGFHLRQDIFVKPSIP